MSYSTNCYHQFFEYVFHLNICFFLENFYRNYVVFSASFSNSSKTSTILEKFHFRGEILFKNGKAEKFFAEVLI